MISCRTCKKDISSDAKVCPNCGADRPKVEDFIAYHQLQMFFGGFMAVSPIIGTILSATTENFGISDSKWSPIIAAVAAIGGVIWFLDAKSRLKDTSK